LLLVAVHKYMPLCFTLYSIAVTPGFKIIPTLLCFAPVVYLWCFLWAHVTTLCTGWGGDWKEQVDTQHTHTPPAHTVFLGRGHSW